MRKPWTKDDESILIDSVARSIRDGHGIGGGIVDAAFRLQRTPEACRWRYYQVLTDDRRMKPVEDAKEERFQQRMAAYKRTGGGSG